MEKKISTTDEARLTRAIEKAASLASVNDSYNRSKLLADQLRQAQVDKRFAKTAAMAFNKRLTVLTLSKTADEHKAESFSLADADEVYMMLGGEPEMRKQASRETTFFAVTSPKPTMRKTASAPVARKPYEETVTVSQLMDHIEDIMAKQASEFSTLSGKWQSTDSWLKEEADKLRSELSKEANEFTAHTVGRLYGQDASELVPGKPIVKSASVVRPVGGIYDRVEAYMVKKAALKELGEALDNYREGLEQFIKAASSFGEDVEKLSFQGKLNKSAELDRDTKAMLLDTAVGLPAGLAEAGWNAGTATIGNAYDTGLRTLNDARRMYDAGRDVDVSPGRVLDAEFVNRDRMRDRMLAWSDMAADPAFSMYPSSQLFQATHRMMDTDLMLERPDRRELLRAHVAQALPQNNRLSTADIAALAQTIRGLASSDGSASVQAADPVYKMDAVKAPALIEFNPIEPKYKMEKSEILTDWAKGFDEYRKEQRKKYDEADRKLKEKQEKQREQADKDTQTRNQTLNQMVWGLVAGDGASIQVDANGHAYRVDAAGNRTGISQAEIDSAKALAVKLYDANGDKALAMVPRAKVRLANQQRQAPGGVNQGGGPAPGPAPGPTGALGIGPGNGGNPGGGNTGGNNPGGGNTGGNTGGNNPGGNTGGGNASGNTGGNPGNGQTSGQGAKGLPASPKRNPWWKSHGPSWDLFAVGKDGSNPKNFTEWSIDAAVWAAHNQDTLRRELNALFKQDSNGHITVAQNDLTDMTQKLTESIYNLAADLPEENRRDFIKTTQRAHDHLMSAARGQARAIIDSAVRRFHANIK